MHAYINISQVCILIMLFCLSYVHVYMYVYLYYTHNRLKSALKTNCKRHSCQFCCSSPDKIIKCTIHSALTQARKVHISKEGHARGGYTMGILIQMKLDIEWDIVRSDSKYSTRCTIHH